MRVFNADEGSKADLQWHETAQREMDAEFPGLAALSRPLPASVLSAGSQAGANAQTKSVSQAFGFRLK